MREARIPRPQDGAGPPRCGPLRKPPKRPNTATRHHARPSAKARLGDLSPAPRLSIGARAPAWRLGGDAETRGRQADGLAGRQAGREKGRQTGRQADSQTDRPMGGRTGRSGPCHASRRRTRGCSRCFLSPAGGHLGPPRRGVCCGVRAVAVRPQELHCAARHEAMRLHAVDEPGAHQPAAGARSLIHAHWLKSVRLTENLLPAPRCCAKPQQTYAFCARVLALVSTAPVTSIWSGWFPPLRASYRWLLAWRRLTPV